MLHKMIPTKPLLDMLMRSEYKTIETSTHTKYFNDEVEVLARKNIISLVLDKRKTPMCMYTDVKTAIEKLNSD
jgi:hypothetical protein